MSRSSANAAGTLISAANRSRFIATITGRLWRNSTHGPSGTATAAPTASPAAASADTSVGPACSTRIAINGNASNASHVPNELIAYADQSQPNCRPSLATTSPCPRSGTVCEIQARDGPRIKQPVGGRATTAGCATRVAHPALATLRAYFGTPPLDDVDTWTPTWARGQRWPRFTRTACAS